MISQKYYGRCNKVKKLGAKVYIDKDVLTAARERISLVFDEFENIVCSFSGGKDSTALVHLALEEAEKRDRKINVFFLDQEAEYQATIDQVERIMSYERVIPYWFQVPCYMTNSTSYEQDFLYAWGEGEKWIRDKHPLAIHSIDGEYPKRFYKFIDWFEKQWDADKTCFLVGLRAEESLNRFRAVVKNPGYKDWHYSTLTDGLLKVYPIYDWTFEDVWIYIANNNVPYNKIYDFMYANGFDIKEMRVSNLIHENSFKCLTMLPMYEPDTYNKLMERIGGIHVAARYANESTIYNVKQLPKRFKSWKEYRDFLLETSPLEKKERFIERFKNQPDDEYTYRGQCKQILLNDWENNIPVPTQKAVEKRKKRIEEQKAKWRELLL